MSSTQEVGDIFGNGNGPAQAMLRAPTVLILCVGLWGMNIFFYRLFNIDYKYVFNYDLIEINIEEKEKAKAEKARSSTSNSRQRNGDGYAETSTSSDQDIEMSTIIGMDNSSSSNSTLTTTVAGSTMISTTRSNHNHNHKKSPRKKGSSRSRSPPITSSTSMSIDATTKNNKSSSSASAPGALQTPPSSSSSGEQLLVPELFAHGSGSGGSSILWYKLVMFSILLLLILHYTTHYWIDHLKRGSIGAVGFFYCIVLLYIFIPLKQNEWLRRCFIIILKRTFSLIHPRCYCIRLINKPIGVIPRRIPFIDVFYADAMCSLSKVFFDWGMLSHAAMHYPNPVPAATHNIIIPSICAAIPYLIRARQCIIMYTVCNKQRPRDYAHKIQHLMNAFKYSTSMYPLILSAYIKTYTGIVPTYLNITLIVLLIINASYSLYWDIVMDWGMMQDPYKVAQTACRVGMPSSSTSLSSSSSSTADTTKGHNYNPIASSSSNNNNDINTNTNTNNFHHACLRPRLRYGLTLSTLIVIADSFLRFSWTLKFFVPNLFPSNDAFVLCTQFLEVFRRAIWNLLRVEWENMKQQKTKLLLINNNATTHHHHHHDGKAPDSLSDHGDFHPNDHDLHLLNHHDDDDINNNNNVHHHVHHKGGIVFEMQQPLGGSSSLVVDDPSLLQPSTSVV